MKLLKKPLFGIIILLLGVAVLLLKHFLPVYYNGDIGDSWINSVCEFAKSEDGRYAILEDDWTTIHVVDDNDKLQYSIRADGEDYFEEIVFDEDGTLLVLVSECSEGEYCGQVIKGYDKAGKYTHDYYYNNSDENSIWGMQIVSGQLCYLEFNDSSDDVYIVNNDMASSQVDRTVAKLPENYVTIIAVEPDMNGNYVMIGADRSCGVLYKNGTYEEYITCDYDVYDNPDGTIAIAAAAYNDGIAAILDQEDRYTIFYVDKSSEYATVLADSLQLYSLDGVSEEYYGDYYVADMNTVKGGVALYLCDEVIILGDDGDIKEVGCIKGLPLWVNVINIIHKIGLVLGCILVVVGIVLSIGNLMHWHMNLLFKQLIVVVPVVVVMFAVLTAGFVKEYDKRNQEDMIDKLLQLNEGSVTFFDGDELQEMTDFSIIFDGRLTELENTVYSMICKGEEDWAENTYCSIYLLKQNLYGVLLAYSGANNIPFGSTMDLGDSIETLYKEAAEGEYGVLLARNDSAVLYTGTYGTDSISAVTLIYNSDDEPVAMLLSNLDFASFEEMRLNMIRSIAVKAAGFLLILIALIVFTTYINTRRLKKAGIAITEIASGNFNARVKGTGHDEVGAICEGVNAMAKKLELHFEELDRNEKFYYKFVPEKFKELLHKDNFTDLTLGDAESADLTVLFCDIRSFSLNSEMMTAKENFEFVNVIYGKAGPIIRKHNGFVDKYIGDAVMALFENADDALNAGKELYREIVLNPETAKKLGVQSINIGIGIHSGMARVGIVGEDERLSGTVISNTVNISSRLESLTKQYNTAMIITKETLDRLSDPDGLGTRYLGMIQVAGVNEVKALYEVLDCLDDERKTAREKTSHDFREAIKVYHMGKAEEARDMLSTLVVDNDADPVPAMYLEYVNEKLAIGDNEHNVFKFEKK